MTDRHGLRPAEASAPGKLVLAGEYAVLTAGEPAVVAAVDARLRVRVEPSREPWFRSAALGADGPAHYVAGRWTPPAGHEASARFVTAGVEAALAWVAATGGTTGPFGLQVDGTLGAADGAKYGFGGSAACTTAVVAAVLAAHGQDLDPVRLFKLVALAHARAQGGGSGVDVAASVFGGVVRYSGYDRAWLAAQLAAGVDVPSLVVIDWPGLAMLHLNVQSPDALAVGWTGASASTPELIRRVGEAATDPGFLAASRSAVLDLADGLWDRDASLQVASVRAAREALRDLADRAGMTLETEALARLADLAEAEGGAGKLSGAGGGDCGLAALPDSGAKDRTVAAWREAGLIPLDVTLGGEGVRAAQLVAGN